MKKLLTLSLGILFSAALLIGCVPAPEGGPIKIKVSDDNSTHHLNLYVAQEKGFFTEKGLDVEITQTSAGVTNVVSGSADIVFNCPTGVINTIGKSKDAGKTPAISIIAQVKIPCTSVLVVPINSDIVHPSDLNGKTIAGLSATCCAVIAIQNSLTNVYGGAKFNLSSQAAGGPILTQLEAAYAAGGSAAIAGAILEEPFVAEALLKLDGETPKFKVLFNGEPLSDEHKDAIAAKYADAGEAVIAAKQADAAKNLAGVNPPCRTINANTKFLTKNTEAAKLFVQAIEKANELILADPSAADIVDIAQQYVTGASRQAIINSNPKLGFTTLLDTAGLLVYAQAVKNQPGTFVTAPSTDWLFAQEFKGITWGIDE